jgi:mitochondrial fission protein ELM1
VWVVSDGRAGIENQALGLAEAVGRQVPAEIEVKHVRWPRWLSRAPTRLIFEPRRMLGDGGAAIQPPWPDLWIGNGRAAIPYSIAMRRWSHGHTYVVQLQDPVRPPRLFDLVVPPQHDRLAGPNVLPVLGAPHRVTEARLAEGYAAFAERLETLPHPRVALLIGGRSKAFDLSVARAKAMADEIDQALSAGGSVLATFSRRTPEAAKAVLAPRLARHPGFVWDGEGPNPYFALLAAADVILVTEDSTNMPTEAAATGKPIYIVPLEGRQARRARFLQALYDAGVARPFEGALETWSYPPLRETDRVASAVLEALEHFPKSGNRFSD